MRMENKHKLSAAMHRQLQPATNNKMGGPLKANKPRKMVHSFSQIIEPKKSEGIIIFLFRYVCTCTIPPHAVIEKAGNEYQYISSIVRPTGIM